MCILRYFGYLFICCSVSYFALASERIGTIGIVIGQADVVNRNIDLKIKENIYFGDVIRTGAQTNLQILFEDETVFTIGENTEIVINEFIYDPNQNNELNKISAEVMQGSLKVVTGLISKENPENLLITLPTGVLATRGTEVQALVKPGQNDVVVLLGPGPNNAAGERAGSVEVSNNQGSVFMDQQFSFTSIVFNQPPSLPQPAPVALIQEINQSLNAGTIALANIDSELVEEDSEPTEEGASNEDTVQEESDSDNVETLTSISSKAVNEEIKSVMVEEFNSEDGLLKASIPKVMKIVVDSKARINNNNITESESSMLNNINNMMTNQLNLVQTIADDNFMAEFNTYLASYELVKLPALVTARNDAREAGAIAKEARQAVQKEKAAAKAEGRAVNQDVIKEARAASKQAIVAKKEARQAKIEVRQVASVKKAVSKAEAAVSKAEALGKAADNAEVQADKAEQNAETRSEKAAESKTKAQTAKQKSTQAVKKAQAAKQKSTQATKKAQAANKKAAQAKQAVKKEKAAAKAEGRAVNKSVIKKAQTASKKAKQAKKQAVQVKKQAKVSAKKAAVAKRQAKVKAKQAKQAKKVAARASKKARQAKAKAAKKAKQAKKAAVNAARKAAAAAKKAAALAAKNIVVAVNTPSTWQEINSKTSGSYTYDANSISLTASTGSGTGSVNGESTIDFAARTIKMTYDGSVTLGGTDSARSFSATRTRDYSSGLNTDYIDGNSKVQESYNFNIDSSGNTNTTSLNDSMSSVTGVSSPGDGWLSTESGGSNKLYFVNTEFQTNNGSSTTNLATTGAFSVNVENLDGDGNIENKITGSKTVTKD
tara:strand:- start:395 stop:2887 length:2493 start_codon:yes stop_codon:yes gene_type:complete